MYTSPHHEIHCDQKSLSANMQGGTLTSTGARGTYAPLYQPVKILACAMVMTLTGTMTSPPVVEVYRRPIAGANSNRVLYCRFANPLAHWATAGNVIYYDETSIIVSPGEEFYWEVITASGGGAGACQRLMYAEPVWENPVNNPKMIVVNA